MKRENEKGGSPHDINDKNFVAKPPVAAPLLSGGANLYVTGTDETVTLAWGSSLPGIHPPRERAFRPH